MPHRKNKRTGEPLPHDPAEREKILIEEKKLTGGAPGLPEPTKEVQREGTFQQEETGRPSGVSVGDRTFLGLSTEDVATIKQQQGVQQGELKSFQEQGEIRRQQEETAGTRPREQQILSPEEIGAETTGSLLAQQTVDIVKRSFFNSEQNRKKRDLAQMRINRRGGVIGARFKETGRLGLKLIPLGIGDALVEFFGIASPDEIIRNFEQKLEPYTQDPTNIVNQWRVELLTKDEALTELRIISDEVDAIELKVKQELIKSPRLVSEGVAQPIQSDLLDARKEVFDSIEIINSVVGVQ